MTNQVNNSMELQLSELYISLKNHFTYLLEEEPNNLKEIQETAQQIADTLGKLNLIMS